LKKLSTKAGCGDKEACGNGYLSLLISCLVLLFDLHLESGNNEIWDKIFNEFWPLSILIALIIIFLAIMHFEHVKRQNIYIKTVIKEHMKFK
jgi:hypothetical protein